MLKSKYCSTAKLGFNFKRSALLSTTIFIFAIVCCPAVWSNYSPEIALQNEGVTALNAGNFKLAKEKFESALRIDPSYALAKSNLAIAYNNYALSLVKSDPETAILLFQKALEIDPNNLTTKKNLDAVISQGVKPAATLEEYTFRVQNKIKTNWNPPAGKSEGLKAIAVFKLGQGGSIQALRLDSSGNTDGDAGILKAVRQSAPFGKFPPGSPEAIDLQMDFAF